MNPSRHAWLVLATAAIAGCASSAQWDKPGATETALKDDSEQCRVQARFSPLPPDYAPVTQGTTSMTSNVLSREEQRARYEAEAFQKCMTGKGYSAKR
jgi:hypothetical protein